MIFSEFKNIDIENEFGVSPVGPHTILTARYVQNLKLKTVLDVGTGTGFLPIYLTLCGFECDGCDINPRAIDCANKNAMLNKVKTNFYLSDLFNNINKKYDLIIFNPPVGNVSSSRFSRFLEFIKSILPRENNLFAELSLILLSSTRKNLLKKFFASCSNFLNDGGKISITLHKSELSLLDGMKFSILESFDPSMRLILIQF